MARYSREHKAHSHEKILKAAAALFKKHGYPGTGVEQVMNAAGLTVGSFYAHFSSKAALLSETLGAAAPNSGLFEGLSEASGPAWVRAVVRRYLSPAHRDRIAGGCPIAALAGEMPRSDTASRKAFEKHIQGMVQEFGSRVPGSAELSGADRTLATFCLMVGGLALSRAVVSAELSDRILEVCRKFALGDVAGEDPERKTRHASAK